MWELLKYLILGTGVLAYPFMQISLFICTVFLNDKDEIDTSRAAEADRGNPEKIPDVEIMLCPHHARDSPADPAESKSGVFSFLVALIQPRSVGSVRLASTDPQDRAKVELNYLDHPDDVTTLKKGVRFVERLADEVRRQGYPLGQMRNPSATSPEFDAFLRANIRSAYHFTSTCRMAPLSDSRPGVVDDELGVHGVSGLRICDTSVFTEPLATHTMAPAVVVAEKLADILKLRHTSA